MKPVRRSQAITPFGPGAMVDFSGPVTLIHAGIEAWPFDETDIHHREFKITDEPRLAYRLGVDYFVLPPDFRRPRIGAGQAINLNIKLPFLRFPRWHVCPIPSCGRMHYGEYHDRGAPECTGRGQHEHRGRTTFQVRFVTACPKGHLNDFPWVEWVFGGEQQNWMPDGEEKWLTLKSSGSASLMGMQIRAEQLGNGNKVEVVRTRSLAGAFGNATAGSDDAASTIESPLSRIGVSCTGVNPVLATGTRQRPAPGCGEHLQAILKSATNIYFPNVVSSIYIPEVESNDLDPVMLELLDDPDMKRGMRRAALDSDDGLVRPKSAKNLLRDYHPESAVEPEGLAQAANEHLLSGILLDNRHAMVALEQLWKTNEGLLTGEQLIKIINKVEPDWKIEASKILAGISEHLDAILGKKPSSKTTSQSTGEPSDEDSEEIAYRRQEYRVFTNDIQTGFPKRDLDVRSRPVEDYSELAACGFQRIALLHKLRETRAFDGFSRINSSGISRKERRALFAPDGIKWLPAIIVRGEGIFVEFSHERIAAWETAQREVLDLRLRPLRQSLAALADRRNQSVAPISPGYLLLHTFAHILITELVQECGYGSASLRERIYSGSGPVSMSGVLIYTAAGDSEGTMGGLVRMGEPDRFGSIVINAINKARWCSSDPVCVESQGQGPGNCNLAACHSCALLPETSCEVQNRLLDRAMLGGTLENPEMGYFHELL